jgi:ABC-type transport system substrate-binding protein
VAVVVAALWLLLSGATLLSGCAGSPSSAVTASSASPSPTPRSGGTLDYPLQYDVNTMLPFRGMDSPEAAHQVFEGLVAYETGENGQVATVPCLAESWEANGDATVWTFHLRRGVRFQEPVEREVTAADVVADFRYLVDAPHKADVAYMASLVAGTDDTSGTVPAGHLRRLGVEALDRYTVRFTLKRPHAGFPDTLGGQYAWVWPVDYLERVGRHGFEERPVGTGPFVLSRRVRGRYVDLVRNPGWWNAASGEPYLESVHFVVFGSVAEELQAFQAGRLDYTWVPQGQVAASRSLPQVTSGEWVPLVLPREGTGYLSFNLDDPVNAGEAGLLLRQAVDAAIDRRALVDAVSDGLYVPQTGLVPPVFPGWEDEQPAQPYDPTRAKELYAQAGSPVLTLTYDRDRLASGVVGYVRQACAAAGIKVRVREISWDHLAKAIWRGHAPSCFTLGWMADYPDYQSFLNDMYSYPLSKISSGTHYNDPAVNRLLELARSASDSAKRLDLSRRAAHEVLADMPVLPLFEFADYRLLSARVGGFRQSPMYQVDAWKLWIK